MGRLMIAGTGTGVRLHAWDRLASGSIPSRRPEDVRLYRCWRNARGLVDLDILRISIFGIGRGPACMYSNAWAFSLRSRSRRAAFSVSVSSPKIAMAISGKDLTHSRFA
jgi:hypothetical protein